MDSTLYLLSNVPLRNDYQHTIDFDNLQAQQTFFDSLISNVEVSNENYSYIRETEIINIYKNKDDLINCNYLFYNNGGKRYYAFITSKEYVSDECTAITFEIDVMQTFMFDYTIGETFIEREHQDRYIEIENNKLKPVFSRTRENLERGNEFYLTDKTELQPHIPEIVKTYLDSDTTRRVMYWVTVTAKGSLGKKYWHSGLLEGTNPTESETTRIDLINNNVYTYVIPIIKDYNSYMGNKPTFYLKQHQNESVITAIVTFKDKELVELCKDSNVISMNISPYAPFDWECEKIENRYYIYPTNNTLLDHPAYILSCYTSFSQDSVVYNQGAMFYISNPMSRNIPQFEVNHDLTIEKESLSYNQEKNIIFEPKLKTADYEYLQLEIGDQKTVLNNENFDTNKIELEYLNTYSAKGGISYTIKNYAGQSKNFDKSLIINSATYEMALLTDEWLNYLRNNKNSLVSGLITGAIGTVGGAILGLATGGIGLAVAGSTALSYGLQIANQLAQQQDMKDKPNEIKNTTFDLTLDILTKGIYLKINTYKIHNQFRNRIFNYFYHYGYLAQYFNIPNIKSRYYFNYIKTVGANIISNIDNNYIDQIKSIFDNGITIWHYRNMETWHGVGNYSYENVETNLIGGNND